MSLVVLGENHPEVALIDSNIGLILHAVGEYDLSLKFLEKALQLNLKYHGPKSLKVRFYKGKNDKKFTSYICLKSCSKLFKEFATL